MRGNEQKGKNTRRTSSNDFTNRGRRRREIAENKECGSESDAKGTNTGTRKEREKKNAGIFQVGLYRP